MDQHEAIENYFGVEAVHPAALALVIVLGIVMLCLPRRWAILPMILASCFVSMAQRFVLADFNFDFLRLMILFGWVRLILRGELKSFAWNAVDRWLVAFALMGMTMFCLLRFDGDSIKNRLGWAYDVFGFFFLFRFLIRDEDDVIAVVKSYVIASVPVAALFLLEFSTSRNPFSALGGVPEFTWIRDGRLRCQGAFAHPIVAGVYWASALPAVVALWWRGPKLRKWAVVGTICILATIGTTNSSTPVMFVVFSFAGLLLFLVRGWMNVLRWAALAGILLIDVIMNKPVWHLMARINLFDSSTGWHRAHIMDEAVKHLDEWWFAGTLSIGHWDDVSDMTNEYVATGITGGMGALIAFIGLIVGGFIVVGRRCRAVAANTQQQFLAWSFGATLFAHVMTFIALSYFGQVKMAWYLLLATIASLGVIAPARARVPAPAPARPSVVRRRSAPPEPAAEPDARRV